MAGLCRYAVRILRGIVAMTPPMEKRMRVSASGATRRARKAVEGEPVRPAGRVEPGTGSRPAGPERLRT
ncbi:hypothetical protein GCM10027091_61810 [Streptomyces daliensis]